MTDRYNYLTVVLEQDIRSDDAEPIINAIKMLRHVVDVRPNVTNSGDWAAQEKAKWELRTKLWEVLK